MTIGLLFSLMGIGLVAMLGLILVLATRDGKQGEQIKQQEANTKEATKQTRIANAKAKAATGAATTRSDAIARVRNKQRNANG